MNDDLDKKKKHLKKDDIDLWQHMTSDVDPMPGAIYEDGADHEEISSAHEIKNTVKMRKTKEEIPENKPMGMELDRRTDERLRRGKIAIEARLDLHGYRQHEAKDRLEVFIKNAQTSGKRCVLVITGKGSRMASDESWMDGPKGVLKQIVPNWLSQPPLAHIVLKTVVAQPKDGGGGAFYVYLRRQRQR